MKRRLFVLLFVAGLLVLGILAIACGDDGGENDEDASRNTIQEAITACNAGDSERYNELRTAGGPSCPPGAPNELEVLSVTVDGDEATAEIILTDNEGEPNEFTVVLRKEDGRWLLRLAVRVIDALPQ